MEGRPAVRVISENPFLMASFALNSMMLAFPMTSMLLFLTHDLGLAHTPEKITGFYALEMLPFMFKTVYGGFSDFLPVFGYRRRPYMVLGNTLAGLLYIVMGQVVSSYRQLCVVGVMVSVFTGLAESGADGALVERSRTGDHQAAAMALKTTGSVTALLLSTVLLTVLPPSLIITLAGVFGILAGLTSCLVKEAEREERQQNEEENVKIHLADPTISEQEAPCTPSSAASATTPLTPPARYSWRCLITTGYWRALLPPALFFTAFNAVPNAMVYETYVFSALPHLPPWALSLRSFLGQGGSLVGVLVYWRFLACTGDPRWAVVGSTLLAALASTTQLVFTVPEFVHSVDAPVLTSLLLFDTVLTSLASRIAFMPLLTLAAAHSPPGLEALTFAALTTCFTIGNELSQLSSSVLINLLEVGSPSDGTSRSWHLLPLLMVLASVGKILVLPLLVIVKPPSIEDKNSEDAKCDESEDGVHTPLLGSEASITRNSVELERDEGPFPSVV